MADYELFNKTGESPTSVDWRFEAPWMDQQLETKVALALGLNPRMKRNRGIFIGCWNKDAPPVPSTWHLSTPPGAMVSARPMWLSLPSDRNLTRKVVLLDTLTNLRNLEDYISWNLEAETKVRKVWDLSSLYIHLAHLQVAFSNASRILPYFPDWTIMPDAIGADGRHQSDQHENMQWFGLTALAGIVMPHIQTSAVRDGSKLPDQMLITFRGNSSFTPNIKPGGPP